MGGEHESQGKLLGQRGDEARLSESEDGARVAAVRSTTKAQALVDQGIRTVTLNFDRPELLTPQ